MRIAFTAGGGRCCITGCATAPASFPDRGDALSPRRAVARGTIVGRARPSGVQRRASNSRPMPRAVGDAADQRRAIPSCRRASGRDLSSPRSASRADTRHRRGARAVHARARRRRRSAAGAAAASGSAAASASRSASGKLREDTSRDTVGADQPPRRRSRRLGRPRADSLIRNVGAADDRRDAGQAGQRAVHGLPRRVRAHYHGEMTAPHPHQRRLRRRQHPLSPIDGDRVDLEIVKDKDSDFYQWFSFPASPARAGRTLTFRILNAGGSAYPFGWPGYKTRASTDRAAWRHDRDALCRRRARIRLAVATRRSPGSPISRPIRWSSTRRWSRSIAAMPGVTHRELGHSARRAARSTC